MVAPPNRHSTLAWRKSSASGNNNDCVEVARLGRSVLVRDSKDRSGPTLALVAAQWQSLLTAIQNGELDDG